LNKGSLLHKAPATIESWGSDVCSLTPAFEDPVFIIHTRGVTSRSQWNYQCPRHTLK